MNILNTDFNLTEKDNNIFMNPTINNNSEDENQNMKSYFKERYETKLTLRKKKINETLLNRRKIEEANLDKNNKFDYDKLIVLKISFIELISNIAVDYKDEEKIIKLLNKISFIIENKYRSESIGTNLNHNIYNFTCVDLMENNWAENLCTLTRMYFKSEKVILYISRILLFSCLLINESTENNKHENNLLDERATINKSGYFISSDKYIDTYNTILDLYLKKDTQISYNMLIFIGNIIKDNENNQKSLYLSGTLKLIIDSIDLEIDSKKILVEKIWCLSKFDLNEEYDQNLDLSLSIQKIYVDIFLNQNKYELFDANNQEIGEDYFLLNYLKVIENTSYCLQNIFIENFIKSNILEFLMDNMIINIDPILLKVIIGIIMNITNADSIIGKRLVNIGVVKYLLNIINNKTLDIDLRMDSLVPINNLMSDSQMWNIILFDQKVIETFCKILNDENIDQYVFNEVCIGINTGISYCENDILNKLIDEYYVIQLVCKAFKQIISGVKTNKKKNIGHLTFIRFCNFILSCLSNNDNDLINKVIKKFQNAGGEEIIDNIINIYSDFRVEDCTNDEEKEIKGILEISEAIKDTLYNY